MHPILFNWKGDKNMDELQKEGNLIKLWMEEEGKKNDQELVGEEPENGKIRREAEKRE